MRYLLELSFNGTNYHGWQIQPNSITVQGVIEKALTVVLNQKIDVCGVSNFESRFKNWPYFFDLRKDQNIGLMLRHLYLAKSYLEEIDDSKGWKVRIKSKGYQEGAA